VRVLVLVIAPASAVAARSTPQVPCFYVLPAINGSELCGGETISTATRRETGRIHGA